MVVHGKPALILAPMEGITDAPMRNLQGETKAFTHAVTEFVRVNHEVLPAKVLYREFPELRSSSLTTSLLPVQLQLLGGDPECLAKTALLACSLGATAIDLNFGCPAPTVNRHDGGATLLKYPHRIGTIIQKVRESVPFDIPVSAKLRLGWDTLDAIFENALRAEQAGASWITIHGRTKEQGYKPPAFWRPIGEVRSLLRIPVVANGDIWSIEDFRKCRKETGCEHFMIGRGALADPLLPEKIAHELGLLPKAPEENQLSHLSWLRRIQRLAELNPPSLRSQTFFMGRVKQWLRYAQFRGTINWFPSIKNFQTLSEFEHWCSKC